MLEYKLLTFSVVCPQNVTAVLKGFKGAIYLNEKKVSHANSKSIVSHKQTICCFWFKLFQGVTEMSHSGL